MGVMPCSRGNCEHIMCDRYSTRYGYICSDCFKELVKLGVDTDIEEFMGSDVPRDYRIVDDYEYFNRIFSTD